MAVGKSSAFILLAVSAGSLAHSLFRRLLQQHSKRKDEQRTHAQTHPIPSNAEGLSTDSSQKHDHGTQRDALDARSTQSAAQLRSKYAGMAAAFNSSGLDPQAIAETAAWFETGPIAPWPRRYASFVPKPLPPGAVRLMIVPLSSCNPQVANLAARISGDVLSCLPPGYKVFSNARSNFHITVFHFSHPADTRPDTIHPLSGLGHLLQQNTHSDEEKQSTVPVQTNQQQVYDILADARAQPVTAAGPTAAAAGAALSTQQLNISLLPPPCERPGPTDHQLLAEQAQAATLVANTPPFTLEVDRVLLARSGVLLLTWVDPSGELGSLRRSLQQAFPGACIRQSNIIHTSLFRIVQMPKHVEGNDICMQSASATGATQLSSTAIAAVQAACEKWTNKIQGMKLYVDHLWWTEEQEFSTVEGIRVPMGCMKA